MLSISHFFMLFTIAVGPSYEDVRHEGQAVLLTDALQSYEIAVDAEPISQQVVLKTDTGAIIPLLSNSASRALFQDEQLRDRPIQVRGRQYEGVPYLLVTSFRVREDGAWRTPEYYCDVCTISVRYPQPCPCCQGTMELRMRPEGP